MYTVILVWHPFIDKMTDKRRNISKHKYYMFKPIHLICIHMTFINFFFLFNYYNTIILLLTMTFVWTDMHFDALHEQFELKSY